MSDLTIDDKIEQLVRSVLAAVDVRLDQVRQEVHTLAADVERRHEEIVQLVQDVDLRIERRTSAAQPGVTLDEQGRRQADHATKALLERIEAAHERNVIATNERFEQLHAAVEQLRVSELPLVTAATPTALTPPSLDTPAAGYAGLSAPFVLTQTRQHPVLTTLDRVDDDSEYSHAEDSDQIDIDRLTDLLSERLSQLTLPTPVVSSAPGTT